MRLKTLLTVIFLAGVAGTSVAGTYEDLISGAQRGDTRSIGQLLARGAFVDTADQEGNTLLMIAAREGHADLVAFLARQPGITLNARNSVGDTALGLAALFGRSAVVAHLLDAGASTASPGWPPLVYAAFNGHRDIAALLIERGSSVNAASDNGTTALIAAARNGHLPVVRLLLEHGASLPPVTDHGENALDVAVRFRHADIAELLKAKGATPARALQIELR